MSKIYFRKFKSHKDAEKHELDFWLSIRPEKKVAAVDSCLIDYLRLKGSKNDRLPRLQRICRLIKRPSR